MDRSRAEAAKSLRAEAKRYADSYQIILQFEDGEWYGRGLELPQVFGDGKTPEACVENTREALEGAVAFLLEQGQRPPAAATTGQRTEQVNVRLTAEEKVLLEASAKRKGFSGLSEFVRAAAIEATTT
ncbi:MAG: type II toxin-antitoxin system HicB family antitoxin [Planctomycetia bacterium]|nr:type II toxin-antitoxin system HicB family antitoxin [Planctomycetia bacterium]